MQETLTRLTFPLSTTSALCSEDEFVARINQRPGKEARIQDPERAAGQPPH